MITPVSNPKKRTLLEVVYTLEEAINDAYLHQNKIFSSLQRMKVDMIRLGNCRYRDGQGISKECLDKTLYELAKGQNMFVIFYSRRTQKKSIRVIATEYAKMNLRKIEIIVNDPKEATLLRVIYRLEELLNRGYLQQVKDVLFPTLERIKVSKIRLGDSKEEMDMEFLLSTVQISVSNDR